MSCQGKLSYGESRGFLICGTRGSILVDRDGYQVFSVDDKKIDEQTVRKRTSSQDLLSIGDMTDEHSRNLIGGIRHGEKLRSRIEEGNISVTILQLANIAWKVRRTLRLNRNDAHIVDDPEAMTWWKREYEKGWELTIQEIPAIVPGLRGLTRAREAARPAWTPRLHAAWHPSPN